MEGRSKKIILILVILIFTFPFISGCVGERGRAGSAGTAGATGPPGAGNMTMNMTQNMTVGPTGPTGPTGPPGPDTSATWNLSYYLRDTSRTLTGMSLRRDVNNDVLVITGGSGGIPYGAQLQMYGGAGAHNGGTIFSVGDAAGTGVVVGWSMLGTTDTPELSLHDNKIVALHDPDNAQDAATKFYVDSVVTGTGDTSQFLFLNGTRVMTGNLSIGGRAINNIKIISDPSDAVNLSFTTSLVANVSAGGSGGQIIYFNHSASPDVAGFETLNLIPSGNVESDESIVVNSGLGEVIVDPYVTDLLYPAITNIPPGLWRFRTYHYVSNAGGDTNAVFKVYKRSAGGAETLLFTATSEDINALAVTEYLTSYVQTTAIPVSTTDRLEIKVYGQSTSVANKDFHFVYDGSIHTSHVLAPISVLSSLGEYAKYNFTSNSFTGTGNFNTTGTGNFTHITVSGGNITQVKIIEAPSDVTNKSYVDDAVAAGGTATWANYVPVLTWETGTPAGITTVARYIKVGKVVTFTIEIVSADSNGATGLTISLPEAPANNANRIAVTSIQRVGGT